MSSRPTGTTGRNRRIWLLPLALLLLYDHAFNMGEQNGASIASPLLPVLLLFLYSTEKVRWYRRDLQRMAYGFYTGVVITGGLGFLIDIVASDWPREAMLFTVTAFMSGYQIIVLRDYFYGKDHFHLPLRSRQRYLS